jgi:hypothetical protein
MLERGVSYSRPISPPLRGPGFSAEGVFSTVPRNRGVRKGILQWVWLGAMGDTGKIMLTKNRHAMSSLEPRFPRVSEVLATNEVIKMERYVVEFNFFDLSSLQDGVEACSPCCC